MKIFGGTIDSQSVRNIFPGEKVGQLHREEPPVVIPASQPAHNRLLDESWYSSATSYSEGKSEYRSSDDISASSSAFSYNEENDDSQSSDFVNSVDVSGPLSPISSSVLGQLCKISPKGKDTDTGNINTSSCSPTSVIPHKRHTTNTLLFTAVDPSLSPLHVAVLVGDERGIALLLPPDAKETQERAHSRSSRGDTPLHLAALNVTALSVEIFRKLVFAAPDVAQIKSSDGLLPLQLVCGGASSVAIWDDDRESEGRRVSAVQVLYEAYPGGMLVRSASLKAAKKALKDGNLVGGFVEKTSLLPMWLGACLYPEQADCEQDCSFDSMSSLLDNNEIDVWTDPLNKSLLDIDIDDENDNDKKNMEMTGITSLQIAVRSGMPISVVKSIMVLTAAFISLTYTIENRTDILQRILSSHTTYVKTARQLAEELLYETEDMDKMIEQEEDAANISFRSQFWTVERHRIKRKEVVEYLRAVDRAIIGGGKDRSEVWKKVVCAMGAHKFQI